MWILRLPALDIFVGTPYHDGMEEVNTPIGGADDIDWRHAALCGGMSQENDFFRDIWYAEDHTLKASIATSICFQCPVRMECLKQACDNTEPHGIWGGLPPSVRTQKGRVHNFLKLADLPDVYSTEDTNSPFHTSNLNGGHDGREQ